ncbi:MAG: RsmE family RNA methyltransferase [Ignavibacteria bacterium]|jgi:16S rRNA (uracil1498-N3)-methyltransferase
MEYYYTPVSNVDLKNNTLVLDDFEHKHLVKVLRKKIGDSIKITDGLRNIFDCKIVKISGNSIVCEILEKKYNLYEPEINLKLFIAPLRNNSRFEFAVEKAVELGVNSIHPVITEFTISKSSLSETKLDRYKKIIVSAMGQSQRCYLPGFDNVITFENMIISTKDSPNKIVMYEYADSNRKSLIDKSINEISLLIGPEGGFSKKEINLLINNKWQVHSLGDRKIRAETAAIVSIFELLK